MHDQVFATILHSHVLVALQAKYLVVVAKILSFWELSLLTFLHISVINEERLSTKRVCISCVAIFHAQGWFEVMNVTYEIQFALSLVVIITLFRFVLNVKIVLKGGFHVKLSHVYIMVSLFHSQNKVVPHPFDQPKWVWDACTSRRQPDCMCLVFPPHFNGAPTEKNLRPLAYNN